MTNIEFSILSLARRLVLACALLLFASQVSIGQSPLLKFYADRPAELPAAEVLILGTYHMDNPGRDMFNTKADDVLAPQRQAEIVELLTLLTRFRPNKIAIEANPDSRKIKQYQDYLTGKYELGRDERDQIGFQLGKKLKLTKIYGINSEGDFPIYAVQDYAKAHGLEKEMESLMEYGSKIAEEENNFLKSHSVLGMLLRMNSIEADRRNLADYAMFVHFGEEYNDTGARLLTEWYHRNMRIHTNLLNIIEPGDRVFVVFGAGHLPHLRRAVQDDPTLKLRTIEEFVSEMK